MKICLTSDLHGELPEIPDCNLLLIGGDLCYSSQMSHQAAFLEGPFTNWITKIFNRGIAPVFIAGNHDFIFENHSALAKDCLKHTPGVYLENSGFEWRSLKIWGTPGSLPFYNWAFNYPEKKLEKIFSLVSEADIIISHGPPFGYGDNVVTGGNIFDVRNTNNVGSTALLNLIDRIKPRLVLTGHIHESYGIYQYGVTTIVNASLMTRDYRPDNPPIIWEL